MNKKKTVRCRKIKCYVKICSEKEEKEKRKRELLQLAATHKAPSWRVSGPGETLLLM